MKLNIQSLLPALPLPIPRGLVTIPPSIPIELTDPNLVCRLRMSEVEGPICYDSSGKGNDGKLMPNWPLDAPRRTIDPIGGTSIVLDGENDYILIPASESLAIINGCNISLEVKPKAIGKSVSLLYQANGYAIILLSNGKVRWILRNAGNVVSRDTLIADDWNKIEVSWNTINPNALRIEINGIFSNGVGTTARPVPYDPELVARFSVGIGAHIDVTDPKVPVGDRDFAMANIRNLEIHNIA